MNIGMYFESKMDIDTIFMSWILTNDDDDGGGYEPKFLSPMGEPIDRSQQRGAPVTWHDYLRMIPIKS